MSGQKTRTQYSARNVSVALIGRGAAILMGFFARVVFTHTLSADYVGVNGLFTDILNVLSLSELGISTAVSYALYKPVSENNVEKQKSLMKLYAKFYRFVALLVLIFGLLILPFMKYIIRNDYEIKNLTIIYLMYVGNTVLSYFMIYKKTLIDAHQLGYIGTLIQTMTWLVQSVIQIAVLLLTHNYILYLSIWIAGTVISNLLISHKADKMYPYLKDKNVVSLEEKEKKDIFKNIRAMMLHKTGNVLVNNTDNILISSIVGIVSAGMYSNYYLIIGSIQQVVNQVFQGITASVGNLGVNESPKRIRRIFEASFFIGQWMFGYAAITLYELLNPFVGLSFGKQYVFPLNVTLILCINFYINGMRQATLVFRDSLGLFKYDKYKAIPEAVINLAVSIVLGIKLGVFGIFLGTLVSCVLTSLWIEPYVLYKHNLNKSPVIYFVKYAFYAGLTGALWWLTDIACSKVTGNAWVAIFLKFIICTLIVNAAYALIYWPTKEYRLVLRKGLELLRIRKYKNTIPNISGEEALMVEMVAASINPDGYTWDERWNEVSEKDLLAFGRKNELSALLYDIAKERGLERFVKTDARKNVLMTYKLFYFERFTSDLLEKAGVANVILKGPTVASYYPVSEYRTYHDCDVLIFDETLLDKAIKVLTDNGFSLDEDQPHIHHKTLSYDDNITLELHTMLCEPFDNETINLWMQNLLTKACDNRTTVELYDTKIRTLGEREFLVEIILHMLQHFLTKGIGIRFLIDWTCILNKGVSGEAQDYFNETVENLKIKGFSDIVTKTCIAYMGLAPEKAEWLNITKKYDTSTFMKEVLDSGVFGASDASRLVVLREDSVEGYVREFHHQMKNNHPKASKCILLWPVLWVITGVVFIINNRKVRNTSTTQVLKSARQRSNILDNMDLWQ